MDERQRWACMQCPAMWETDGRTTLDGGGTETVILDGQRRTLYVPGKGGKKKPAAYCFYCRMAGRKIGDKASWSGLQPKWCPRLPEDAE